MGEALSGPAPTGRTTYVDGVGALVFERRLVSSPERVWSLAADPDLARAWLGRWQVDGPSGEIELWGAADEDEEPTRYRVTELVPTESLELTVPARDASGWQVRIDLTPAEGGTLLRLLVGVPDPTFAPLLGAAADFYLDRLAAVDRGDAPAPVGYEDYVAVQARHYRALFPGQRRRVPVTAG